MTVAIILGICPLFGYLSYNWFFKTWATTIFGNAYNRELSKKNSTITIKKLKREKNWVFIITVLALLALGFFSSWMNVVGILAFALLSMLFGMIEGLVLLGLGNIFALLFPKKKKEAVKSTPISLSPVLFEQIEAYFKLIHQDFQSGKYEETFARFPSPSF